MPEDSKHELPERYAPLVKYVSTKFPKQTSAFDSAFRRIESRRLLAAQELRKALQSYWSAPDEQLKNLSPLDLVHYFEAYAEAIFRAVGEMCLGQFHDSESYRSYLHVVQNWVLDAIFPKPQTFKQSQIKLLSSIEAMLPIVELADRFDREDPLSRALAVARDELKLVIQNPDEPIHDRIREAIRLMELADRFHREDPLSPALAAARDELKLVIQTPDEPIHDRIREAMRQERIIGLRENFSAFEGRCSWDIDAAFSWGGDWEEILDDSLADVLRRGSDSIRGVYAGQAFMIALRNSDNRVEAENIWTVALEHLHDTLLGAWWDTSADAHAENEQIAAAGKGDDATTLLAQTRSEWLDAKLAGKYSDVDLDKTTKISYNTIANYRSGGVIRDKTRRGLSDALNELGISCEFPEVPR